MRAYVHRSWKDASAGHQLTTSERQQRAAGIKVNQPPLSIASQHEAATAVPARFSAPQSAIAEPSSLKHNSSTTPRIRDRFDTDYEDTDSTVSGTLNLPSIPIRGEQDSAGQAHVHGSVNHNGSIQGFYDDPEALESEAADPDAFEESQDGYAPFEDQAISQEHQFILNQAAQDMQADRGHRRWNGSNGSYPPTTEGSPPSSPNRHQINIDKASADHQLMGPPRTRQDPVDVKHEMISERNIQYLQAEQSRRMIEGVADPRKRFSEGATAAQDEAIERAARTDANVNIHNAASHVNNNVPLQPTHEPKMSALPPPQQVRNELDYDPAALAKLAFSDLQTESFDKDPGDAMPLEAPGSEATPLAEKLQRLVQLSETEQLQVMRTFSLQEWEDAGAWFMEQFHANMIKMTESRRGRREIARRFEAEVAKRHEEVSKERQDIAELLARMKSSGGNVIREGTPKRKRG